MDLRIKQGALWVLALIFFLTLLGQIFFSTQSNLLPLIQLVQICSGFVFAFIHGSIRYGGKGVFFFFVTIEIITFAIENLSIATGFPFGHYHYAPQAPIPFIGAVPITTGMAYFLYGYIAWWVATTLLRGLDAQVRVKYNAILLPACASLTLLVWNIVAEPISSTLQTKWIWENSGVFNGVPLTKFFGLSLTFYLFFQVFALFLRSKNQPVHVVQKASFWILPVLLYFFYAVTVIAMYLSAKSQLIEDAIGKSWDAKSIYATAALASSNMLLLSSLALFRYIKRKPQLDSEVVSEGITRTAPSPTQKRDEEPAKPNISLRF